MFTTETGNMCHHDEVAVREDLSELLKGGFAPVVILLREFPYDKAGIILDGLHFSAWILLRHMHHRQSILLRFMQSSAKETQLWPQAYWPKDPVPESEEVWNKAIGDFEDQLEEMIRLVKDPETALFERQQDSSTFFRAAVVNLQHNAYHIGQIKTVGRQLGVW